MQVPNSKPAASAPSLAGPLSRISRRYLVGQLLDLKGLCVGWASDNDNKRNRVAAKANLRERDRELHIQLATAPDDIEEQHYALQHPSREVWAELMRLDWWICLPRSLDAHEHASLSSTLQVDCIASLQGHRNARSVRQLGRPSSQICRLCLPNSSASSGL